MSNSEKEQQDSTSSDAISHPVDGGVLTQPVPSPADSLAPTPASSDASKPYRAPETIKTNAKVGGRGVSRTLSSSSWSRWLPRFMQGTRSRANWEQLLRQVNALEEQTKALTEPQLRKASLSLRYRAKSGETLAELLPEAYALCREAGRRTLNMRHYDVQILGGIALFTGCIAEMQTGEGKTLTATLPLYLHSLLGKGAHLATVNDYLAGRDADWMKPLYDALGISIGKVLTDCNSDERRRAYNSDITYGTAKEFGFDFLRDRLLMRAQGRTVGDFLGAGSSERWNSSGEQPVQRGMHFCLVDEADSILIDEARTPLIIGSLGDSARETVIATFRWASEHASKFNLDEHYTIEDDTRKYELTARGRQAVRALPRDEVMLQVPLIDLYEYIERAVKVLREFIRERQYVVRDGEIVIVDEFTGRLAEGRKWRDGIHQALEAKEGIEVSVPMGQAARITVQDLFQRYKQLAGMTGTAATSARELKRIYKTPVIQVPTNRPPQRVKLPDRVYGTMDQKFKAIVEETREMNRVGRPVLIGTRSIDKSLELSKMLKAAGIEHEVLNASEVAREAEIVASAGHRSKVTVATNMAGRGTDIKLAPGINEIGGMHVICTELHDAARIDRQLIGRCGRQGDPGSHRQYLSLDDDILKNGLGTKKFDQLKKIGESGNEFHNYSPIFRKSQMKVERKHFRDRMALLYFERERNRLHREMGQDPYLDTAE